MKTITINNEKQEDLALISFGESGVRWGTDVFPEDFKPSLADGFSGFPYNINLNILQITL